MAYEPFNLAGLFAEEFQEFRIAKDSITWARVLLDHHRRIQRRKPPNGKAPWFEEADDGKLLIRVPYRVEKGGRFDGSYVHLYRTAPIHSFITNLERRDP